MCGIGGFTFVDDRLLDHISRGLAHRGPDDRGEHTEPGVSLCHRRLAIVDLSDRGRQPMYNESGDLVAVVNGEIYNYPELRDWLVGRGHRLRSECDSEVVLHLFEEMGPQSFGVLDGMFALALYDRGDRSLYLAVDHLGIKNLYHTEREGGLRFASDLAPLLDGQRVMDRRAIDDILTYGYIPSPAAPVQGIRLLEPGTYLRWSDGSASSHRYHAFRPAPEPSGAGRLLQLLERAVSKCLMSDVPVAVALSGGLDSALVLALTVRHRPDVTAICLELPGQEGETAAAREVAGHFGVPLAELRLTDFDVQQDLPAILRAHEVPQDTGSMLPKWYLAREASRLGIKVVLGGSGADETWYGYRRHPWLFQRLAGRGSPDDALTRAYFERWVRRYGTGDPWLLHKYQREQPWVDLCAYFDVLHELPFYHNRRLDKLFMAFGVEYRPCFLDRDLVSHSLSTPLHSKLHEGERKALLRRAAATVLPDSVCQRPKIPLKIAQVVEDERGWLQHLVQLWKQEFSIDEQM